MPDLMLQTVSHEVTPTNYLSPSPFQGRWVSRQGYSEYTRCFWVALYSREQQWGPVFFAIRSLVSHTVNKFRFILHRPFLQGLNDMTNINITQNI
jgi:hypothetical protein